jgi:hypothetical protein
MRVLFLLLTLALAAGAEPLFNGKNLDGWVMTGPGRFVVEDGQMKTEGGMGLLYSERKPFGNCRIKVVFRTASERANSGLIIRLPEKPTDPWYGVHNGYEVQIDAAGDDWHTTGSIYSISKVSARNQKPQGEWNTLEVELNGPKTRIFVNGTLVNEYTEGQPVPERKQWYEPVRGPRADTGYIGLQNHDPKSIVYFKEISVTGR